MIAKNTIFEQITPDQLAAMPNEKDFELVDGLLVERNMGNHSALVALQLARLLYEYVREHKLGWVFGAEAGYRLDPDRPNHVRKPDVSFVRVGRFTNERPSRTYDFLAPDLAVEVISPNDLVLDLDEKVEEYLQAGVRLVWLINPELRTLTIHRPDRSGGTLRNGDTIDGKDVVPGFRCRLSDIFELPIP
ncbi:MAG: Uma2 family endonuclease [Pirellulaceae bacterium]|nr:Uma2 family endonuclease [Pirellulaceae bacterium]